MFGPIPPGLRSRPRVFRSQILLQRLAHATGMKVEYDGPAPRQIVLVTLSRRPLAEAVQGILIGQGLNFAILFDPTGARVDRLIVATASKTVASSRGALPGSGPRPAGPAPAAPEDLPPPDAGEQPGGTEETSVSPSRSLATAGGGSARHPGLAQRAAPLSLCAHAASPPGCCYADSPTPRAVNNASPVAGSAAVAGSDQCC